MPKTWRSIFFWSSNGFTRFVEEEDNPFRLHHNFIRSLAADTAHTLWIGTQHGLSALDLETMQFTRTATPFDGMVPEKNRWIIALHLNASGTLWVGSDGGGLAMFNTATRAWTLQPLQPNQTQYAENESVRTILEDQTGLLWTGLWDRGLYKETPYKMFTVYPYAPNAPGPTLSNPIVTAIHPSTATEMIWIGTFGGLNALHLDTGHIEHFQHDPNDARTLSHNEIWDLEETRDGTLWIVTMGGGLNRMDPLRKTFEHYRHQPDLPGSISSNNLYSILEDKVGRLWIGTVEKGLNKLSRPDERFTVYLPDSTTNTPNHYAIWPLLESRRDSTLWMGTMGGGLIRYDLAEERFFSYVHDPNDPTSISGNFVQSIYEDDVGDLWIGMMGRGLNRYHRAEDRFYRYTTEDGLPHNTVTCVTGGRDGERWISTLNGLARLDVRTQQIIRFNKSDGLPSNTFRENACYEAPDGTLYFGSEGGLVAFRPEQILVDPQAPSVMVTGLDLFNKPLLLDSTITYKKHVSLRYNQNVLTFHFSALHYAAPIDNEYAYRLEGVNKDWQYVKSDQRSVTYANLSPGHYVFRVKASNSDGVWNEQGASIQLIISPPWWRTWWAYGLYILFLGLMVAGFVRWWISQLEHKRLEEHAERLAEIDRVKSRFFANISHEFRTPLTLVMGPLRETLKGRYGPVSDALREKCEMMLRNSDRLRRLINQILDLAKIEAGSLALEAYPLNLVAFVRKTVQPFTPLAETQNITLQCRALSKACIVYFDPDAMEKVFTNLLSNALKFTPRGGQITVTICQKGKGAEVEVRDNGSGIPEDELVHIFDRFYQVDDTLTRPHEGTGIGLSLANELVELHGGEIKVESSVGVGSAFAVCLRLGKQHLRPDQIVQERPSQPPGSLYLSSTAEIEWTQPETSLSGPHTPPSDTDSSEQEEDVTTVLVVDDNADVRSILEPTYRVLEAEHGVRGLEYALETLPDLVIADVMMPEMDGFSLSRALQNNPTTDSIPVVFLTARAATEDELTGLETGAVDYVTKPFEANVLRARVASLIAFRLRLRERLRQEATEPTEDTAAEPEPALAKKARHIILTHLHQERFNVKKLATELKLSYSWMHARFKNELDVTPSQFIRTVRVEQAAKLIEEEAGNISEIAYAVGFNSLSYFTKSFRARFDINPSEYAHARG